MNKIIICFTILITNILNVFSQCNTGDDLRSAILRYSCYLEVVNQPIDFPMRGIITRVGDIQIRLDSRTYNYLNPEEMIVLEVGKKIKIRELTYQENVYGQYETNLLVNDPKGFIASVGKDSWWKPKEVSADNNKSNGFYNLSKGRLVFKCEPAKRQSI